MRLSLNEVEVLSVKAARGAGLAWGLAEEAGKAARWLAARGLPGPEALAACLSLIDGRPYAELVPVMEGGPWRGRDGPLDGLVAGVALGDLAPGLAAGETVETAAIAHPILVIPFLARATDVSGRTPGRGFGLAWPGVDLALWGGALYGDGVLPWRGGARAAGLRCAALETPPGGSAVPARAGGVAVERRVWDRLQRFARRTYVPASPESRRRGAGAGLDDND